MALPWARPLTYDDLQAMPEDGHRYELVDGVLLVSPGPSLRHQDVVTRLGALLLPGAGPDLAVLVAPFDYKVSDITVLEPDLLVFRRDQITSQRFLEQAPLLVVEVFSPNTRLTDLGTKRLAFETAGVPAYWLVDPDGPSITELRLEGGRYAERPAVTGDEVFSTDFPFPVRVAPSSVVTI